VNQLELFDVPRQPKVKVPPMPLCAFGMPCIAADGKAPGYYGPDCCWGCHEEAERLSAEAA
jgi:hypothetical protein